jgi:hypothetical protein
VVALALGRLRGSVLWVWFAVLPGVAAHELAHWVVALVLGARPSPPSIVPQRLGPGVWALGHVNIQTARWWNAAPIALAPLSLVPLAVWLCQPWPASGALAIVLRIYIAGCLLASCTPSRADLQVALRSFPALAFVFGLWLISRTTR